MIPFKPKPPKPNIYKKLERSKRLTIAAGFHCKDGLLICADTQESVGDYLKCIQPKIEVRPRLVPIEDATLFTGLPKQPRAIFAGAGDGDFIDYLVEKLWCSMEHCDSAETMIDSLEDRLIELHQKLIPAYPQGQPPDVQLLIALWAAGGMSLLKVSGPIVTSKLRFEAIGFGTIMSKYIVNRLIRQNLTLEETQPIAIYMLNEVKLNVRECGGYSQVVSLRNDGKITQNDPRTIEERAKKINKIDEAVRKIMLAASDPQLTEEEFGTTVHYLRRQMERVRSGEDDD